AVYLQPFVRRGGAGEALEVAPGVQALAAPVRGGQQRDRDPLPAGGAIAVELAVQRVRGDLLAEPRPRGLQLGLGAGARAGHRLPRDRAARAADPVLGPGGLLVVPGPEERAQDAAVVGGVPVEVGGALPDADRGQVRRLQTGHVPGVHRVVGDAVDADLAGAPRLGGGPLDALVEVPGLARGERVEEAGQAARAPGVPAPASR